MSKNNFLEQAERKVFRASFEDGIIDIGIAAFFLMFAVAPLLSTKMGDFWSSFIFLPFWGIMYLLLRWMRKQFVIPRIGRVSFGADRKEKLRRGGVIMLVLNVIFLLAGILAYFYAGSGRSGWLITFIFSAVILLFTTMLGYLNDLPQLFIYGIASALGIPLGEWAWQQGYAGHHGYPMVFGTIATGIFVYGTYKFIRLIRNESPTPENHFIQGDA